MSDTFKSILDRPTNVIERPRPLPTGTYHTIISGQARQDKSAKKGTEFVEFDHKILAALDDVNQNELAAAMTDKNSGQVRPLSEASIKNTYYLTESSAYRLIEFFGHLGFDVESGEYSARQMIAEAPNREVLVTIKHEPTQDGTGKQARVASTAPLAG